MPTTDDRCQKCAGEGWVMVEDRLHECECLAPARERQRLSRLCLPTRYAGCRLDNYPDQSSAALTACREWVAGLPEGEPGLFLWGANGTGKTTLACGVLESVSARFREFRVPMRFWSSLDMLHEIQHAGFDDDDPLDKFRIYRVVVIDDLGQERGTDYGIGEMRRAMAAAEKFNTRLIITSNLDRNGLATRFGNFLSSRLSQFKVVPVKGVDHRRAQ